MYIVKATGILVCIILPFITRRLSFLWRSLKKLNILLFQKSYLKSPQQISHYCSGWLSTTVLWGQDTRALTALKILNDQWPAACRRPRSVVFHLVNGCAQFLFRCCCIYSSLWPLASRRRMIFLNWRWWHLLPASTHIRVEYLLKSSLCK